MNSLDFNKALDAIFNFFHGLSADSAKLMFVHFIDFLRPYSTLVSLLFITGIVYCVMRIQHIIAATVHHDHHARSESDSHAEAAVLTGSAKRWERIMSHLESGRESDWRLAILEADVLLSEMVTGMGYHGESLGEKLKAIEQSDFTTLQKAWEAHGVRNKIAHEGAAFALTEREARRVIMLYEEVFREVHYI